MTSTRILTSLAATLAVIPQAAASVTRNITAHSIPSAPHEGADFTEYAKIAFFIAASASIAGFGFWTWWKRPIREVSQAQPAPAAAPQNQHNIAILNGVMHAIAAGSNIRGGIEIQRPRV